MSHGKASIVQEASKSSGQKVAAAFCEDSSSNPEEACRRKPFGVVRRRTGTRSLALAVVEVKIWVWEEFGKETQEFTLFFF